MMMPKQSSAKKSTPVKTWTSCIKPPKKISSKKSTPVKAETSSIKPPKPSKNPKRVGSEIDEIFAQSKKRKLDKEIEAKKVEKMKKKKEKKERMIKKSIDEKSNFREEKLAGLADVPLMPRKKTGDGLRLYSEDELGIANPNSGGTRLCPFDCDCCF